MSLQVWLPLISDLHNQGVSGLIPVQTTAPTWVDGKLGKAMSTGALYLPANDVAKFYNNNAMSFTFWIYAVGSSGSSVILGQSNMSVGNNRMFTIYQYPSPNDLHLSWQSNESSTTFLGGVLYGVFPSGTWTHCAITYDGAKATVYINGVYQTSWNGVSTRTNFTYDVPIPSTSIRYLNDFRIYDHTLSVKEIKLLSQGLVCHYKLDDAWIESTTNLCTVQYLANQSGSWGGHTYSRTTVPCIGSPTPIDACNLIDITYSGSGGGGVGTKIQGNVPVSPSTTYTYSCYIKSSIGFTTRSIANILYRYELDSSGTRLTEAGVFNTSRMIALSNGWYRCWGSFTTQSTADKLDLYCYVYPDQNAQYYINCWQLEQKDHMTPYVLGTRAENVVYDSSGYNYHGTPTSLVVSSDTPRNSLSTYFDGTTSYVEFSDLSFMPTMLPNEWTFSFWVYNQDSGNRSIFFSNYSLGGVGSYSFGFEKTAGELLRVVYANGAFDRTIPNSTFTVNAWTHIAVSKTAAHLVSVYRNGVLIDSYTNSNCASNGILYRMGRDARSDSTMFSGKLSDFRIYTTVLSAEDIQQLYNAPISISNNGAMFTQGEFIES